MLKLNESEYNLDIIFSLNYDLLKEILIKLSKNNDEAIKEINDIKNTNISRDQRIFALEQKITELNNNINNINNTIKEEKKVELAFEAINNNKEIKLNDTEKKPVMNNNLISIKIDDFIISNEELKLLEENRAKTESLTIKKEIINLKDNNITIKNEKINEKNNTKKIRNKIYSYYNKKPLMKKKYNTDINLINLNDNPLTLLPSEKNNKEKNDSKKIRNILHEINNLKDQINYVEKNLLLKNSETLKISKDLLSEHNIQSMSKINALNDLIKNLTSKNDQLDKALSNLAEKLEENSSINFGGKNGIKPGIIQIFNDNDDDCNKEKKLMSRTFMDSINKRFELNNDRYMKAYEDSHKMKQNISNIFGILNNHKRELDLMKNNNTLNTEEISKIKDQLNDLIELRNKSFNGAVNIPEENLSEINNYIDKKMNELMEYLLQDDNNDNKDNENNSQDQNNKKEKALMKLLNKKMNQLNEKIDLMDEESKLQKKNFNIKYKEIDNITKKIWELNEIVLIKLEQKDLDELSNKNSKNTDEINKMRLKLDDIFFAQEKIRNDTPNIIKKLQTLTRDMTQVKENLFNKKGDFNVIKKEYNTKIEQNGNEVNDEEKLKYMVTPITEAIQKITLEIENINIKIKNITEHNKLIPKKNYIEKIVSNFQDKINSLENNLLFNYLKKADFQKVIKTFDIQIKQLQGNTNNNNNIQKENENWILAKQPIKCFNCASCEANVSSNSLVQNDPISWNKYHGQYRIGQGFSKLLKKLDNKNNEEKDINKTEKKNKLINTSFENSETKNLLMVNNKNENIKMNNKGYEEKHFPTSLKKYKLPRLIESFKRKQKSTDIIPVSDEEKEEHSDLEEASPQLIKITKVKYDEIPNQNILEINNQIKNQTGRNNDNQTNDINRIQSLPLY